MLIYGEKVDYAKMYDEYYHRQDKFGTNNVDHSDEIVEEILRVSGPCRILDVGCGMGGLVFAFLRNGFDATGVDVSSVPIDHARKAAPGCYQVASAMTLPFDADAFRTITSVNFLEHLHEQDVAQVLSEMWRVCSDTLYLRITIVLDEDNRWHLTVKPREWWEEQLFLTGFRKHPMQLDIIGYEEQEIERSNVTLVMQKIPREITKRYTLSRLDIKQGLYNDMTRIVGRRSDAHIYRYMIAKQLIRPGDTVLDFGCGLGYGTAMLAYSSGAAHVIGVDNCVNAITYAEDNFGFSDSRIEFHRWDVAELSQLQNESIDFVVSMECLEHLPIPEDFLAEIHRILKPSGRIIVSVPNMWINETDVDPNPHLHIYDIQKLKKQIGTHFIIETMWSQVAGGAIKLPDFPRSIRELDRESEVIPDAEWWLCLAMKSPLDAVTTGYKETLHQSANFSESHVVDFAAWYNNPYIVTGLITRGLRLKDPAQISQLSRDIITTSKTDSADRGGALCILAYQIYEQFISEPLAVGDRLNEVHDLSREINDYVANISNNPHVTRWKISLTYIQGVLHQMQGDLVEAKTAFNCCLAMDPLVFSPLIATKTMAAGLTLAQIELAHEERDAARRTLSRTLRTATIVIGRDWPNVIGNIETPFIFGFLELSDVCVIAAKCALLMEGLNRGWTNAYIQARGSIVAERDEQAAALRAALAERDEQAAALRAALAERDEQAAALADIWTSSSWRLTRPLRGIKRVLMSGLWEYRRIRGLITSRIKVRKVLSVFNIDILPKNFPWNSQRGSGVSCPSVAMLVRDFHHGGLERVVIDITTQFLKWGITCPILVVESGGNAARLAEQLGCSVRAFEGDVTKLVSTVQEENIKIVVTHHCYEPLEQLSMSNVKIVEVIHNPYHWQRDLAQFLNLRRKHIDHFVAVSDTVRDYALTNLSIPVDRIRTIENGLSRRGFIRPEIKQLIQRRKTTAGQPLLIHLANVHPQKNHVAVLRAFKCILSDYPDANLVMAGVVDDTTHIGRYIRAEIEANSLDDRVRCPGILDQRSLSRLLADAHVGLLPSTFEGFSISSLEYTYFGLPSVLSDTGAARLLAKRYKHILIADAAAFSPGKLEPMAIEQQALEPDASTVAGIAAAIRLILRDYSKFADAAQRAGMDWKSYSIEMVAHRYRDFLMETAA